MESEPKPPTRRWLTNVLLLLVLVAAVTNLAMTYRLTTKEVSCSDRTFDQTVCTTIPYKLVYEDPVCANKYIEALGVRNVHVAERNMTPSNALRQP